MPKKKNIKKLVLQSQYVTEDYNETTDKMVQYKEAFYKEFPEEYKRMIEHQDKMNKGTEDHSEGEDSGEQEIDEKAPKSETMRKLYRRISKITHPDKVESEFLTSYFKKASTAYSEDDVAELFTIASTLDIDISDINSDDIASELESSIQSKSIYVSRLKGSMAWVWAHAETEEEKQVIRNIITKHVKENY